MNYEITNLTEEKIDTKIIEDLIKLTSNKLNVETSVVEVILTENEHIREINKTYRGIDKSTDVISFAFQDSEDIFLDGVVNLGEIYISIDKVHEQAKDYGHSFERELGFLTVHGLLHLLGYDHMEKSEEEEMFSLQEEILKEYGLER